MKIKLFISILLLTGALLILSGCAGAPTLGATADPEPTATAEPTPTAEPAPTPEPTPTPEPLPDVDITSWEFRIANMYTYIGRYEAPLVSFRDPQMLDERIVEQANALIAAAEEAGYRLYVAASYRSFDYFEYHYTALCSQLGSAAEAVKVCMPGGCSDHNTGLAIDFTSDINYSCNYTHDYDPDFENTEAYQWLLENSQHYGFVHRYIDGKEEYYGLACCAGHFRYVGVEAAEYMTEHDLCLEEFVALYQ